MRHLVACPSCRRQYDATGRAVGSSLRCRCGAMVRVPAPHDHAAAVVRCSNCGAARTRDDGLGCAFCQADFTLHERDLHTVCAGCQARVSDRARFCHHCGVAIAPEPPPGPEADADCPACGAGHRLRHRPLAVPGGEGAGHGTAGAAMECPRCAGMWLGNALFRLLAEHSRERALHGDDHRQSGPPTGGPQAKPAPLATAPISYRPCPECRHLMQRRNYAQASGVIVDVCTQHGTWFDADELSRILVWVRTGGLDRARAQQAEAARATQRKTTAGPAITGTSAPPRWTSSSGDDRWPVLDVIDVLFRFWL